MKKPCHAVLARHARSITRMAKHLLYYSYILSKETDHYRIRLDKENIDFIILTMRKYADAIRSFCERRNISGAQEIIIDALRAAKRKQRADT